MRRIFCKIQIIREVMTQVNKFSLFILHIGYVVRILLPLGDI